MSDARDRLDNKSPDELEHDIEETRARISDEMNALGHRLGPEGLRDSAGDALQDTQDTVISVTEQLKQGVIESSDSIGGRVTAFIKQNPLPATLFGVGLAWLLKQGSESGSQGRSRGDVGSGGQRVRPSSRETRRDNRDKSSTTRSSARGGVRRYEREDEPTHKAMSTDSDEDKL